MNNELSFIPLGGIGDVTKNMYLYEYKNQILIVDCGLGFADETMLGIDLLLPDISYLLQTCLPLGKAKKLIVGMILSHGHEDHIGALPFILPQLPNTFPVFGTPLTAALANVKLSEFKTGRSVQTVSFANPTVKMGDFSATFIHVTHSIPDTSHIFIKTPMGNFYHGSDFKFDDTPPSGDKSDYNGIKKSGGQGVLCLLSDCLGSERSGRTTSEIDISSHFIKEIQRCKGKFIVTTYSSSIARLNQIIAASEIGQRKVCFIGRSLQKIKDAATKLGYLKMRPGLEIEIDQIKQYPDHKLTLIVAGSQGQEESALARISNGEHREVTISENDTIIFSADPIPGNEATVYQLIDTIAKKGPRILYSSVTKNFHVSGHGASEELSQLISLIKPKKLLPIGGGFRQMLSYSNMAKEKGYKKNDILLLEDGQEVIFQKDGSVKPGRTISVKNVYVDEISGEEVESFVLRDRQKLSEGGIVIILCQIDAQNGELSGKPDVIVRGFTIDDKRFFARLLTDIKTALHSKNERVTNWIHMRKLVGTIAEKRIFRDLRRRPLLIPVVIEV